MPSIQKSKSLQLSLATARPQRFSAHIFVVLKQTKTGDYVASGSSTALLAEDSVVAGRTYKMSQGQFGVCMLRQKDGSWQGSIIVTLKPASSRTSRRTKRSIKPVK